jgi:hypothetical protein
LTNQPETGMINLIGPLADTEKSGKLHVEGIRGHEIIRNCD